MNTFTLSFASRSENESFARVAVSAFAAQLDPTVEEVREIQTVISEAVTNAIIHGYQDRTDGTVTIYGRIEDGSLHVSIIDFGVGMEDVALARTPLYTSKPDLERSGIGFTIMEQLCDAIEVDSTPGRGTRIELCKRIAPVMVS
jgi:stage II sporulation protein AB (anti-sigma F factor)